MNILKEIREEKNISQSQLAMWSGVSKSMIKKLETDKRNLNKISLEMAYKFAVILQVPMEYFIDSSEIELNQNYIDYFDEVMENIVQCYPLRQNSSYIRYSEKGDPYDYDWYDIDDV